MFIFTEKKGRLRKKYRNLKRARHLYNQTYGPKVTKKNFIFDTWTSGLGNFFIRHGNRRFGEEKIRILFKKFYHKLRQKGYNRWIVRLGEKHLKPDYLYTRLRHKFPRHNVELKKRKEKRLQNKILKENSNYSFNGKKKNKLKKKM